MKFGRCAGCDAKDAELVHLREQNKALTDKLLNLADPLLHARLANSSRPRPERHETGERPMPASVQMLAHELPDKPDEFPQYSPSAEEVEASFEDRN